MTADLSVTGQILAALIGCGLRRAELVALKTEDFQLRGGP
jgi:integrase